MLDFTGSDVAVLPRISEVVEDYEQKKAAIPSLIKDVELACAAVQSGVTIRGKWGGRITTPSLRQDELEMMLRKSGWEAIIEGLQIRNLATAADLQKIELSMQNPPELELDTITATFGKYITDPRTNILRGVAEVFVGLDPAYKSHSKVKIGVDGLPKKIILNNAITRWGDGYNTRKLYDIINALRVLDGLAKLTYQEERDILSRARDGIPPVLNGITIRGYKNGNAHLIFDKPALTKVNRALAEYYGDALAEDLDPDREMKKEPSREVSAKLQYYPTPAAAADELLSGIHIEGHHCHKEKKWINAPFYVLEPSCGDGNLLDAMVRKTENVQEFRRRPLVMTGIEFDSGRVKDAQRKGYQVMQANFLQVRPDPRFDLIIMNPPFAGKHWKKHVLHALKFLNEKGTLRCILPATAWYDDAWLKTLTGYDDNRSSWQHCAWTDLPVGSFAESGTNVPTGYIELSASHLKAILAGTAPSA